MHLYTMHLFVFIHSDFCRDCTTWNLSLAEFVVLLPEQLLNKATTVRGAGKPHVDPLREPPQHCVVQVLQTQGVSGIEIISNVDCLISLSYILCTT